MNILRIILPTRPQPDTLAAIFLLKSFGEERFPGIRTAAIEVRHTLAPNDTFDSLVAEGALPLDVGGGLFDHHEKDGACASELVAKYLGIEKDPSLKKLLAYAKRDDQEGKGTLSSDPLDRAFGLSGLISSLNKQFPNDPDAIVRTVLPLLEAHYQSSREHYVELPNDVERKKREGDYQERMTRQKGKPVKIAYVVSDKPSMPTFLRSMQGARADVVVQKSENTNHFCILTQQSKGIDLSMVMALIRLREAELAGITLPSDPEYLKKTGRIDEIAHWYFDPATKSLLNGGTHNQAVPESSISWDEMKKIVQAGIEIGGTDAQSTYYLSLPIPLPVSTRIVESIEASSDIHLHDPKDLHITLEYFGERTKEEAAAIAAKLTESLAGSASFNIIINTDNLVVGSPEGYKHAWYLDLEAGGETHSVQALRLRALEALGMPARDKAIHITLATKKDSRKEVPPSAVSFQDRFELSVPLTEVVLMEGTKEGNRSVYKPHTAYTLD